MALSVNTVWEIRANGTATGGGGFVTGASGTDYTQQDAVQITRTDIVIDAVTNTNITSVATAFTTAEIGNLINITSGTGFTVGRYEITAVDGSNIATLDRAVGTVSSTGGNGVVGGAMTLSDANLTPFAVGHIGYLQSDGTHTLVADIALTTSTTTGIILLQGYNTTRGDVPEDANRPLIACGANEVEIESQWLWSNIRLTGTSTEVVKGSSSRRGGISFSSVNNSSGTAGRDAVDILSNSNYIIVQCEIQCVNGFGITANGDAQIHNCYIHDCDVGVLTSSTYFTTIVHCIIDTCSEGVASASIDMFGCITNSTIYNCTKGVDLDEFEGVFINNIVDSCTTGFEVDTVSFGFIDYNNWSNNTADISVASKGPNATSASPGFADAANGDFAPGVGVKATSSVGAFPGGLTTGFLDQGAVQHEDSGGAAGTIAHFSGV